MDKRNNSRTIFLIIIIVFLGIVLWLKYEEDSQSMSIDIEATQQPVNNVVPKNDYVLIQDRFDDETIFDLVREHYEFYRRDYVYREPLIKKINNFRYHISVEECRNNEIALEHNLWISNILVLIIHMDGSYTLK